MSTSAKRSRVVRSSSDGEIAMFTNVKNPIPTGIREFPPRDFVPTFELQPWEPDDASFFANKRRFDSQFLKSCFFCKRKIDGKKDIFMYGYMQAFCSPRCRGEQIKLDGFLNAEDSDESVLTNHRTQKKGV